MQPRKRPRITQCQALDIRGLPIPAASPSASVLVSDGTHRWRLRTVPRPMGPWGRGLRLFLCPACGSRRRTLYRIPGAADWGCRSCLRLQYPTQAMKPEPRAALRVDRLKARLRARADRHPRSKASRQLLTAVRSAESRWRRLWLRELAACCRASGSDLDLADRIDAVLKSD